MTRQKPFATLLFVVSALTLYLLNIPRGMLDWSYNNLIALEWWRLLTSVFAHSSSSHLIYDVLCFLSVGLMVENSVGSRKFLAYTALMALISRVSYILIYPTSRIAGMSGLFYGLVGVLAFDLVAKRQWKELAWVLAIPIIDKGLIALAPQTAWVQLLVPSVSPAHLSHVVCFAVGFLLAHEKTDFRTYLAENRTPQK